MIKKRKALLLSAGYGRGHNSAAQALAEALKNRGWKACVADPCAEARPRLFRATQLFYNACVQHAPWVWGMVYEQIDRANWAALLHAPGIATCVEALRLRLKKEKPGLVVCTYPLYAYMLDAFAREGWFRTPYAVVVTDALAISRPWLKTQAPLICLPDEHSHALVQERYALPAERLVAPGFPVRAAFTPGEKRPIPGPAGEGLHIVYGAYAPAARVQADAEALLSAWPRMQLTVLAANRNCRSLQALLRHCPSATICGAGQDPAPLLSRAHFYVGKAGAATLFEAYAAQTPVIINYALPGQEQGNLTLLGLDAAGRFAESPADLVHTLEHLLANGAVGWQRMCRAMQRAGRTGGAERTAEALERRFFAP